MLEVFKVFFASLPSFTHALMPSLGSHTYLSSELGLGSDKIQLGKI